MIVSMPKPLTIVAAIVGATTLFSCGKGPNNGGGEEDPPPFPIGEWCTTHQYFSRMDDEREILSEEHSEDVSEALSYRLSFGEDGSGSGSAPRKNEDGRFNFLFTWIITDEFMSVTELEPGGYGGVFFTYDGVARGDVVWQIEESTDRGMVLSILESHMVDRGDGPYSETHTYRYTFKRIATSGDTPSRR
jgi:hypothetical protein